MKFLLAGTLALGLSLTAWGYAITEGPGSADERMAGAFPALLGIALIVIDIIVAFGWLIVRA